ncbi:cobyric acid synthase [Anaeromyxobacter oryzisoli]|uniref:cobyric acid synthase n=1 Tax=Anaeromyxobacter oryzisoli TaxID=2925408 RepID=UPI001F55CB76|nr:cobyric acid synthase [Anaeromyxobacter sp. SG63]
MTARTLMIQGTASSVGKSLVTTALCRLFRRAGLRVAPFKAQNMALESAVSADGGEIGRAQAVQAEAAGVAPTVDMNPILLKPEGATGAQVVVLGRSIGSMRSAEYQARTAELRAVVAGALARLRATADVVVIEGAGSPAEVNLKDRDLANMDVARAADAPVLLVGDIDRGGVFAALVGTLALLDPPERARIAAFVVNKFRGDVGLLRPGLDVLTARTGVPVLGVLPFLRGLRLADEDSVALDERGRGRRAREGEVEIVAIRLPRVSNLDDLAPLEHEARVAVRWVEDPRELAGADLVVLPGSKCTASDLAWLRATGLAAEVARRARQGRPVLGICGGCQMLGESIHDPLGVESAAPVVEGLGLLPVRTRFARQKVTARTRARVATPSFLGDAGPAPLDGYEIHMGALELLPGARPAFELVARNGAAVAVPDGAVSPDGAVVGTLLHGLFEDDAVRGGLLRRLRERRGLPAATGPRIATREEEYDRLADHVLAHLDWELLCRIAGMNIDQPAAAATRNPTSASSMHAP